MDCLRKQFFSCAALTVNAHVGIRLRHLPSSFLRLDNSLAIPQNIIKTMRRYMSASTNSTSEFMLSSLRLIKVFQHDNVANILFRIFYAGYSYNYRPLVNLRYCFIRILTAAYNRC